MLIGGAELGSARVLVECHRHLFRLWRIGMACALHGMYGRTAELRQPNVSYRSHPCTRHANGCKTSW